MLQVNAFQSIRHSITAFAVAATLFAGSAQAVDVTGAGSTFVQPIVTKWSATYAEKTGNHINYGGGGLLVVIALFCAYTFYWLPGKEKEAANEMFWAQSYFERDSFKIALNGGVQVRTADGDKAGDPSPRSSPAAWAIARVPPESVTPRNTAD